MTQQNAALVEEAAAASESVSRQAQGLTELVGFFSSAQRAAPLPNQTERRGNSRPWQSTETTQPTPTPVFIEPVKKMAIVSSDTSADDQWEEF
jgi:methyl-accepting chemotaxis protein